MPSKINRRDFLKGTAAAGAGLVGFWVADRYARGEDSRSIHDKLNIAVAGTAGRAEANLSDLAATKLANIVALCDVDDNYLGAATKRFPRAKTYNDYRKMLEQGDIDAVLVSTPDHTH